MCRGWQACRPFRIPAQPLNRKSAKRFGAFSVDKVKVSAAYGFENACSAW
ncbi:hypothetical protein AB434_2457 [Heyndrickxia coagulans]|uniref:Uncharacterized protein n=1 Tax=Heyndrickxia coagulans TaxID=1398 RepID=A0A0C5CDQ8_HEYCO|nr:hypothetical protein SB48_HM08orf04539 [Heyndrickxia coagulans]AKN54862.1 hypothetical protein AB434_2457 [Heyndrickxia coagulans]KWZ77061.1 hypothetical protein HMPREF3213_03475 [Heyndrickxia coagulans]